MKKRVGLALLVVFLIFFVLIPIFTQLTKPEPRVFQTVHFVDSTYDEVSYENSTEDLSLAGMLFLPEGNGPFPAAVIIHGSGTSNRDNLWPLTLTQYLRENGIAVLLPDKRGSEKSEGDWRTSSFEDLARDTLAAISFLKDHDKIEVSQIGVIGISQGGHIAPIVGSQSSDVVFLVNIVGGSVPMHELLLYEENYNLRQLGLVPGLSNVMAYPSTWILRNVAAREFWDAIGNFDPIPYWEKINVSSLVLYGQDDTNVPSAESSARLQSLGKPNIDVRIYQGSGHGLEDPEGTGDRFLREDALKDVRDFIYRSIPAVTKTPAGFSAEDPMSMPEGAGPTGLSTIGLPQERSSIIGLFDRLPERLLGRTRADNIQSPLPDRINVSYGKTEPIGCGMVGFQATDVSTGDFYPTGWAAERVIALFASGSDSTEEGFGRAGELFWVNLKSTCSFGSSLEDSLEITMWGVAGSPWLFSATAQDAKGRDELVVAFVAASG